MIKKKILSLMVATVLTASVSTQAFAAAFVDVTDHPYKVAIDYCQTEGYIKGVSDTVFLPDGSLTRGQLAVILCRAQVFQSVLQFNPSNSTFSDIASMKNYYDTAAIILNSLGIISGSTATTFAPNSTVTREQLAVIAMRALQTGVANKNDYKLYSDSASISDWAQDAVSACINSDVFVGLYDIKDPFQPQKAVTRAEICKLIYNISQPTYNVTIASLTGGTITASPAKAHPGTTIVLTITPEAGKRIKTGTLKFNGTDIDGNTFTMPAADVSIMAEFEDIPITLESISVTTPPTKTDYQVDDVLDLSGLVVTATYSDDSTNDVTGYTTTPAADAVLDEEGPITIAVSYTEGGITKTDSFIVQVTAVPSST